MLSVVMTMEFLKVTDECEGDFALRISDDSMEPYINVGELTLIKRGGTIHDGDVGLFFEGSRIVCRQYCQDWVGNVYLFVLNRKRAYEDSIIPVSAKVPVFCFGKLLLDRQVPLP